MSKLGGPPGLEVSTYKTYWRVWTDVIPAKAGIQNFFGQPPLWEAAVFSSQVRTLVVRTLRS